MTIRTLLALSLATISVCFGEEETASNGAGELPEKIIELQTLLQGKDREEAYTASLKFLGEPARDVGSGFRIEQWDIGGGTLTFHEAVGPIFQDEAGSVTWLVETENLVMPDLHASFEMTSTAEQDPRKLEVHYWLGNLEIDPAGDYKYTDSDQHHRLKKGFPRHFFADHPSGKIEIAYSKKIKASDDLHDIPEGTEVCKITFVSEEASKTFRIVTYSSTKSLCFESDDQVFRMDRGWSAYWPENDLEAEEVGEDKGEVEPKK